MNVRINDKGEHLKVRIKLISYSNITRKTTFLCPFLPMFARFPEMTETSANILITISPQFISGAKNKCEFISFLRYGVAGIVVRGIFMSPAAQR